MSSVSNIQPEESSLLKTRWNRSWHFGGIFKALLFPNENHQIVSVPKKKRVPNSITRATPWIEDWADLKAISVKVRLKPLSSLKKKVSEEQLQSLDMLLRSLLWVFRSIAGTSTAWKYSLEMQWLPYNNIWITFVNVSSRLRYIDCTLPYQDFQTMLLLKIVTDDTILSLKSKAITAVYIHKTFWYQAAK